MNSLKRVSVAVLLASGLAVGTAGVAAATTSYVGGGTWQHGVTGLPGAGTTYSNYHHGSVCHGATAVGQTTKRVSAGAGAWANTSVPRAIGNNQSYWRTSC
ncbi:lactococcin 972 family bacteriocin [Nocardiopsis sp. Huas11]|nr:lactococcin 972 family bacteriocin [Nocardiopsis sp. Huas11]RKS10277.1 lactococcin 972 family bacteriocin [Nocardiopsis sp. Huas11]